jgi:hypothetical protein
MKITDLDIISELALNNVDLINKANNMKQAYFFSQDDFCHWYMIPVEKRELWNELSQMDLDEGDNYQRWQDADFDDYRTGGGIGDIEFIPTKQP